MPRSWCASIQAFPGFRYHRFFLDQIELLVFDEEYWWLYCCEHDRKIFLANSPLSRWAHLCLIQMDLSCLILTMT